MGEMLIWVTRSVTVLLFEFFLGQSGVCGDGPSSVTQDALATEFIFGYWRCMGSNIYTLILLF